MLLFDRIRKYCLSSAWNIGFVEDKVQCVILNDLQNIHWMKLNIATDGSLILLF